MLRLLLASHGKFASGMKSSIDILAGSSEKLTVFDAYVDDQNVNDFIETFFSTVNENDQVILLSDLYGGSVNQVMYLFLNRPNTFLVAGVNLALVLELVCKEEISVEELNELINQSKEMLCLVEQDTNSIDETEFF